MTFLDFLAAHAGDLLQALSAILVAVFTGALWRIERQRDRAALAIESFGWTENGDFSVSVINEGGHSTGIRAISLRIRYKEGEETTLQPAADPMGTYDFPYSDYHVESGARVEITISDGCWIPEDIARERVQRYELHVYPVIGKPAKHVADA